MVYCEPMSVRNHMFNNEAPVFNFNDPPQQSTTIHPTQQIQKQCQTSRVHTDPPRIAKFHPV